MPKSNGEVPRNQKFIPYNYRIEREQWTYGGDESFQCRY